MRKPMTPCFLCYLSAYIPAPGPGADPVQRQRYSFNDNEHPGLWLARCSAQKSKGVFSQNGFRGTGQALALAAKGDADGPWFMRRVWRNSMSRMENRSIGVW